MKISKSVLKQIIKEELENINEDERLLQSMEDELASEVQDMEYQSAMKYLKNMFRAIQKVMVDITPTTTDMDIEKPNDMDMEELDEEMMSEEEVVAKMDGSLKKALEKLVDKFDELDLSIDFLAAVMADTDPRSIGSGQKAFGRSYIRRLPADK